MAVDRTLFLFGTGAGSVPRVPELIRRFLAADLTVYTVLTPNVGLVAGRARLMEIPGNHWIAEYGQPPLDRYPFGTLLVAPCTFNTFNKLAHGIADSLATSMIADGIGAGRPVLIAPSMNQGLWAHPVTFTSSARLRDWGCHLIGPTITDTQVTMAPDDEIVAAVLKAVNAGPV